MNISIRKAMVSDHKLLAEIGAITFYETWRPVNTEEDMQTYMAKSFDLELIKRDVEDESVNTFFLAMNDNEPIGYAKIRRDRTYDEIKNDRAIEIERIYVLKSWQDKKIGKLLMDECIRISLDEKFSWLWLGVNIDNEKAIAFYKKYGFEIFGEKSFQLGDANDTDYLMKMKLS